MPCPFSNSDPSTGGDRESAGDSRRAFLKAAVAIGGTSALAACTERTGEGTVTETAAFPQGVDDPSTLPREQHAWADFMLTDRQGNVVFPSHHVFLLLSYVGDGRPTAEQRDRVESAFLDLERAYQWGAGETPNARTIDGLLFTIAYSPTYFDRFDEDLPDSVDVPRAEEVLKRLGEDPSKAGDADALLHLASDQPQVILSAEEALFGALERVNGHKMSANVAGIFERDERRTGFVGRGLPSSKLDVDAIPDRSPLSMGFKSAFEDTLPSEAKVTIRSGPFAGGTTQHASQLRLDVDGWYEDSHETRVERMFTTEHGANEVGQIGEGLGSKSGVTEEMVADAQTAARERGRVGHSQKLARVRDDDFDPLILRRGDSNATGTANPRLNFSSLQTGIEKFVTTRRAMNDVTFEVDTEGEAGSDEEKNGDGAGDAPSAVAKEEDGILGFIEVLVRQNFLVPPRAIRALPTPEGR